ncbi:MAG: bifunctional diguanylate cyclase/phosphodiesterase [Psychrobium sp.]
MINARSNKNILKLIKYGPITVVLCFSAVMSTLLIKENKASLEREISTLSHNAISQQRLVLKNQIDALSSHISFEKNTATEQLQNGIRERVHEAHAIASGIYRSNQDLPKVEIGKRVKDALRNVRFLEGRGYFFATSLDGVSELLPIQPSLEGTSITTMVDIKGTKIVKEMIALMKERDETFYHYWFQKPKSDGKPYFKVGFIKLFEPLNWYLGTGEYLVDFEAHLQKLMLARLQLSRADLGFDYYIVDEGLNYIAHDDPTVLGEQSDAPLFHAKQRHTLATDGQFLESTNTFTDENGLLTGNIIYARHNPDWHWTLVGEIDLNEVNQYFLDHKAELEAQNEETLVKLLVLSTLLSLLLVVVSFVISRNTAKRFKRYESKILLNLSQLNENKEQLNFLANHDPLTKLPNRRELESSIERDIELCRDSNTQLAVMFFDLDDFKKINDHYGHATGDSLLTILGESFSNLLGPKDNVFRFGGDEFIFSFPMLYDIEHAKEKVFAIQQVFARQVEVCTNQLHVNGSIGIAMYPNDASSASELIRKADLVLYKSKAQQKGQYLFYEQALHQELERALVIETQLRTALAKNELFVVYQPQICAASGQIMGVEALIRWNNDELGFVPPDEFIAVAENIGLIDEIGDFVIEQACGDIANYNRNNASPITVSINVSPAQLVKEDFVRKVCRVTQRNKLSNAYVTIEITENVLISEMGRSRAVIEDLRDHGFDVSLDDFGTGYSSLSYLSQLSINELKIDRSFIMKCLSSEQSLSLVRSIILIAQSGHMSTVAEGVETKEQYEQLRELGCDIIQGYYFSKPLAFDDLCQQYAPEVETLID